MVNLKQNHFSLKRRILSVLLLLFLSQTTNCFSLRTSQRLNLVVLEATSISNTVNSASKNNLEQTSISRRSIFQKLPIATALVVANIIVSPTQSAEAKTGVSTENANDMINTIVEAAETLDKLLSNWDKATIDCTYADIPRELLEQKNKEQLLEKASTFALFDKSTSVVSCKKTNKIVRDYLGVTGKGPLVNVDKKMLKRIVVEKLDPDVLDDYYTQVENFQNAISRASSLSYAAGIADFDSVNNFEKETKGSPSQENSNLEQSKKAISEAKASIDQIVSLLVMES